MNAVRLTIFTTTLIIALPRCFASPILPKPDPMEGSIPESLIGTWEGVNGAIVTYTFHKNGTFDYAGGGSTTSQGCSNFIFV